VTRLAILAFHKIGDAPEGWDSWFYIPEATFVGQLRSLADDGWTAIDVGTVIDGLRAPDRVPEKAALLTFDDGYRSIRMVALPWLRRFGYPAVMFVPSEFVGGVNGFDAGKEPEEPICHWDELRDLQACGVSIQSHGVSHRAFSALSVDDQEAEIVRSRAVLERELGRRVDMFSYPYGDAGGDAVQTRRILERAGYRAACLYGGGPNSLPAVDAYALTRIAMGPDTDLKAELSR
jgi:peptidoglycan/xylan/chitin deacetylase (PgdA/CDA1 family)